MQVLDSLIDGPLRLRNRREGDELIGMIVRYLRTGEEPEPRKQNAKQIIKQRCKQGGKQTAKRRGRGSRKRN